MMALVLTFSCDLLEVQEKSYASRDAVVHDGAIYRGWIPSWIPASARNIRERHNLDTNASELAFEYEVFDMEQLEPVCRPIDTSVLAFPRNPSSSWWPSELRELSAMIKRFSFFICSDDVIASRLTAYLAIDRQQKSGYFWRTWGDH